MKSTSPLDDYDKIKAEIDAIEKEQEERRKTLAGLAKSKFVSHIKEALAAFKDIPEATRAEAVSEQVIMEAFVAWDLNAKPKKGKPSSSAAPRSKVSDDEIVKYISGAGENGRGNSEIGEHLRLSSVTVAKRLAKLENDGRVHNKKLGTSNCWRAKS